MNATGPRTRRSPSHLHLAALSLAALAHCTHSMPPPQSVPTEPIVRAIGNLSAVAEDKAVDRDTQPSSDRASAEIDEEGTAIEVAPTTPTDDDNAGEPAIELPRAGELPSVVRAPQFVLVGLDATPGPDTAATFSRRVGDAAERAGARITYFINTQNFLLSPTRRRDPGLDAEERAWLDPYRSPIRRISYARSLTESRRRLETTQYLLSRGHEMASHGVHHERGRPWALARWRTEFAMFNHYHRDMLGLPPVLGFRAPYLAWNDELDVAETESQMLYDASRVGQGRTWPRRLRPAGIWEIPVLSGRIGSCRALIFDDGIRACRASDDVVYRSLHAEFDARYAGNRAPLVLSSHDGFVESVYIRLLEDVCRMPDVRCTTFADLARFMNEHPKLADYGRRTGDRVAPQWLAQSE